VSLGGVPTCFGLEGIFRLVSPSFMFPPIHIMLPCSGNYSIREEFTHGFLDLAKSMSSLSLADLKWEHQRVGVYRSDEMRDNGLTDFLIFLECPGDTEET